MEGLDELVSMYYPEIYRYCCWHTSNQANAEDAVQETFLKAVRYMDRYATGADSEPFSIGLLRIHALI